MPRLAFIQVLLQPSPRCGVRFEAEFPRNFGFALNGSDCGWCPIRPFTLHAIGKAFKPEPYRGGAIALF